VCVRVCVCVGWGGGDCVCGRLTCKWGVLCLWVGVYVVGREGGWMGR